MELTCILCTCSIACSHTFCAVHPASNTAASRHRAFLIHVTSMQAHAGRHMTPCPHAAQAKVQDLTSASILAGLEVRVAFGEVWKDSLTELSGGQRSLLALSLILAMLLFKPAPIYILDEVQPS